MAAKLGIGALTFVFVDLLEGNHWVDEYYIIIKSDECVPIGHTVNANVAVVASFSLHQHREGAINRGLDGFECFGHALGAVYGFGEQKPGRINRFEQFREARQHQLVEMPVDIAQSLTGDWRGIGTPNDMRGHLNKFEKVGVDHHVYSVGRYE